MAFQSISFRLLAILSYGWLFILASDSTIGNQPVKVFILAGQSNMEGHGFVAADPMRNEGKGIIGIAMERPTIKSAMLWGEP